MQYWFHNEVSYSLMGGTVIFSMNYIYQVSLIISIFCSRNAKSKYLVFPGVPNYFRKRCTYRIFRTMQASDIGRSRDRSDVPSRR